MQYSITRITSKTDCDALLALASKEKGDLDFKKISLERNQQGYLGRSVQLTTDLQVTRTEISALEAVVAGLPEGDVKETNISRKKRMEYRLFTLEEQSEKYGMLALLEKEMQISMIEKQLAEIIVFTQLIEAHKATLQ
jgi:hypothetical protein